MKIPDEVFRLILDYAVGCPQCGCANHQEEFTCALDNYSQYDGNLYWPDYYRLFYQSKSRYWGIVNWPEDNISEDAEDSPRFFAYL